MLKLIVTGNVGSVRLTKTPKFSVLNFSVATHARLADGKMVTNWVAARLWGKRAEGLSEHLVAGQAVAIEGRPEARVIPAKGDREARPELALHVDLFEFIGPKPEAAPASVAGEAAPEPTPETEAAPEA